MFTQVMQNPRFMALLQPPPPSQSIGNKKQKSEPAKTQPQVIHTAESIETPIHLPETMQSPNPVHNAQEQVAETPVLQAVPVQPATFQQPILGSNGQGSDLQAMQQVFPPPSVHPRKDFERIKDAFKRLWHESSQLLRAEKLQSTSSQAQQRFGLGPSLNECIEGLENLFIMHRDEYQLKVACVNALAYNSSSNDVSALQSILADQPSIPPDEAQFIFDFFYAGHNSGHGT
ncbi:hypothetical protein L7F22_007576 [Adiantum nelumboides]|nr:hypothetical protein [Adiantum nelumboides]